VAIRSYLALKCLHRRIVSAPLCRERKSISQQVSMNREYRSVCRLRSYTSERVPFARSRHCCRLRAFACRIPRVATDVAGRH
jgi:hypothetical protein